MTEPTYHVHTMAFSYDANVDHPGYALGETPGSG